MIGDASPSEPDADALLGGADPALLRDRGFTDAELYERGRPGYPREAVELLAARLELAPGKRVVELGAGTGKLTRQLVPYGAEVVAVEPAAAMRARLAEIVPEAIVLDGRAEAIPLPDAAVDGAAVAQAFHWFDAERALAETARVVRPGGWLAIVASERDERVAWVRELGVAMRWDDCRPPGAGADLRPLLAASPHWERVERHRFGFGHALDRERLVARVASTSYIVAMTPSEREAVMDDVRRVVERLPEPITLPYVTDAYLCRTRAR